ncbi:hypothetical protein HK101_012072 [Irineochytrium annulatum]|nr:hypothetical protein HK101_012072 [Irineochytrium annulatum]
MGVDAPERRALRNEIESRILPALPSKVGDAAVTAEPAQPEKLMAAEPPRPVQPSKPPAILTKVQSSPDVHGRPSAVVTGSASPRPSAVRNLLAGHETSPLRHSVSTDSCPSTPGTPRSSKAGGSPMTSRYNRHSAAQRTSLLTAVGTIEREFARMQRHLASVHSTSTGTGTVVTSSPTSPAAPSHVPGVDRYAVADFGCSTGANSIPALEAILRLAGPTPVDFYLVDLPGNDWVCTADALAPLAASHNLEIVHEFPAPELQSTLDASGNSEAAVHQSRIIMTPFSFFDAVFPPNTLHLSFSGTAMHWLSEKPKSDGRFGAGGDARYRSLEKENPIRLRWDTLQQGDWETLIRLRAGELIEGGALVVVLPCDNHESDPKFGKVCASMLADTAADLCARGLMTEDQVREVPMSYFLRSKEEIKRPFKTAGALEGCHVRLTGLDLRVVETPGCRAALLGDAPKKEFAEGVVNLFAAFSTNVWEQCGLSKEVVGLLLDGLRAEVEKEPWEFQYLLWQAYVVVRKEK